MVNDGKNNDCFINGVQYKCRTCFDPGRTIIPLTHEAINSKTWLDLLKDIVKFQMNDDELLPKTLCCKCSENLKRSYDFVLQIANVNKKYSVLLTNNQISNQVDNFADCLTESAITLPTEQYTRKVKVEEELIISHDSAMNKNKSDKDTEESFEKEEYDDPFTETFDENIMSTAEQLDEKQSFLTSESRQKINELIEKVNNNEFLCLLCKKTFTVQSSCRRHLINVHFKKSKIVRRPEKCRFEKCSNEKSTQPPIKAAYFQSSINNYNTKKNSRPPIKAAYFYSSLNMKTFESCLYSEPTAWHHVECKLCSITFKTCKDLRQHFENHNDIKTLHNLRLTDNVKYLFPNLTNLERAKQNIIEDITEKRWFKYYTVLNKYSYEMSISDTEVEEMEDENIERVSKYKCTLCTEEFSYKFQAAQHLKDTHGKQEMPLKCDRCKLEFVSIEMYKQHLQTHCGNEYKNLACVRCPAKFFWPENLKNHYCAMQTPATSASDYQGKLERNVNDCNYEFQKFMRRCCLCAHTFQKLRHLRQHMLLHADGITGIDFHNCIYVKQFKSSDTINNIILQEQIQTAFSKCQISRFYQAVDKFGNEVDISDSESDSSTEEGEKKILEKKYKCEVCNKIFGRRKYLLKHQLERHKYVQMPFSCQDCKQQYVSFDLLQQHLKKECCNEDRRIAPQCEFCGIRLIWPSNMLKHKEMQVNL